LYQRYTPLVEVYSIDEAFLDITDTAHLFGEPLEIGEAIKKAIQSRFGIHATIGVSYNKLMAKLASDISKPNGLRWIKSEEAPKLLESLPPGELCGIGKRTAERLDQMGIKTCGDLGRASASLLRNRFGVIGLRLKAMGLGIDHSPVSPEMEETKSVGHSMTLPRDVFHMDDVAAYLLRLSEMVGSRARRYRLLGSVVTVVVRYKNFETFSKQKKIKTFTNDTHVIYATAMKIIHAMKLRQAVRLLGVSLSSIIKDHGQMYVIGELEKRNKLLQTIDHINRRFGDSTVSWAMYASLDKDAGVISPAWRPSGVHRTNV
jgi:DNA polymerase-4